MRHFTNEDGPEDLTGLGETSGHNGSFSRFNAAEQGAPAPCPPAVREHLGALRLVMLRHAAMTRKAGQGLIL